MTSATTSSFYSPYDSRAPSGGIANWNSDPLTGEIIGAAAQIMGRSASFAAARQRDVIALELGDAKVEDLIEGSQEARFSKTLAGGHTPAQALSTEEIQKRTADVDRARVVQSLGAHPTPGANRGTKLFADLKRDQKTTADMRVASTALLEYDVLAKQLRGTKFEAERVDSHYLVDALREIAAKLGFDPSRLSPGGLTKNTPGPFLEPTLNDVPSAAPFGRPKARSWARKQARD